MLLGDRSFVDREESKDFQKTSVFHSLVLAGLHVGALAVLLFGAARKMRLSSSDPQMANTEILSGGYCLSRQEQRFAGLSLAL